VSSETLCVVIGPQLADVSTKSATLILGDKRANHSSWTAWPRRRHYRPSKCR